MNGPGIYAASIAVYAAIPLLLALRRTRYQFLLLYAHIAAVLTLGGLVGSVYVLPACCDVDLLAGQLSYGGFMFATLVTVIIGRDVQVVRNIVVLTVTVNTLVYLIFRLSHTALHRSEVLNPYGVDPDIFHQSLRIVVLGGLLIIAELLALIAVLELAKRRLRSVPMAPIYVLAFVGILSLDGVLFPSLVLLPDVGLGGLIATSVRAKLILAGSYAIPLTIFLAFYPRLLRRYEATPLHLSGLLTLRRDPVLDQLKEQKAEIEVRTEEAGRATATVTRILDAATNTLLVATDADGRITHFNTGAQELLGYSESEVLGRTVEFFYDPDEIDRQAAQLGVPADLGNVVRCMVATGKRRDWTLRKRTGAYRVLSLSFTEIRDGERLIGYLCAGEDVTRRLRAEAALTEALRHEHEAVTRLEDADRVKDEVVSTISHELRTPIASIQGYSEMLAEGDMGDLNPMQSDALGKVLRNTARLSSLVDDLLQLDRAESGQLSLHRVPTDLVELASGAWDALEQLARDRDLTMSLQVPSQTVPVHGDVAALERVVLNLGANAIKFTPDGGSVTVSIEVDEHSARLVVSDTGIGISPEDKERILGRFFRSTDAYQLAVPGSGLGLTVVDTIVREHDGTIDIASDRGAGTTVTVTLPLMPASVGAGAD